MMQRIIDESIMLISDQSEHLLNSVVYISKHDL